MMTLHTKNFIRAQLLQTMPTIREAQPTKTGCDFHLGVGLNRLRKMVIGELALSCEQLEESIPRLEFRTTEEFSVETEQAWRLQAGLITLIEA